MTSDQWDSSKTSGLSLGSIELTAPILEVMLTRYTPAALDASITARVPSTAGLIRTYGSLGASITKGEAVWITYVDPAIAVVNEASSSRSA